MEEDGRGRTVLLVEDEPSVRNLARHALSRAGYRVFVAGDGPTAKSAWSEHSADIDLLFTDMVMPHGVSGRELADHCLQARPDLRVLYTSGYSVELTAPGFSESTGHLFLQKPYLPQDLLRKVRHCLAQNGAPH